MVVLGLSSANICTSCQVCPDTLEREHKLESIMQKIFLTLKSHKHYEVAE